MKSAQGIVLSVVLSIFIFSCKPKSVLNGSNHTASTTPPPKEMNAAEPTAAAEAPQILFCQLMFYKASPAPKVKVLKTEAVPGTLSFSPHTTGAISYSFMDKDDQVLAQGKMNDPLFFNAEDKDPVTGKLSAHPVYRDSAFKQLRIPYNAGITQLKITFTDSLKKEHLLQLTPLTIKKS